MSRLVVVSNRIAPPDEHAASAGGLAVGILGALKAAGGLWFGWSGETGNEDQPLKKVKKGNITWASFNLSEQDLDEYYNQFSNAVLWPAFHYRLDLVQFQRPAWDGYLRVNALLSDDSDLLLELASRAPSRASSRCLSVRCRAPACWICRCSSAPVGRVSAWRRCAVGSWASRGLYLSEAGSIASRCQSWNLRYILSSSPGRYGISFLWLLLSRPCSSW